LFQDLTELRNLQTMRRELIGNISHDLRTPIAGIKAMVETLQDTAIDDKQVALDFLTRINGEVDRLTQMVTELTELSHIETGKAELRRVPTNLNYLIEEVVGQMRPQAESKPVTITTDFNSNLPVIKVDKDRIRQTLTNLVHNAIKFNNPGGKVTITTTFTTSLPLSVCPIPEWEYLKKIYHIFLSVSIKPTKPALRAAADSDWRLPNIQFKPTAAAFRSKAKKVRVPVSCLVSLLILIPLYKP
jgi:signal transduction histidine kinase